MAESFYGRHLAEFLAAVAGFETDILTGYGKFKLPRDRKVFFATKRK